MDALGQDASLPQAREQLARRVVAVAGCFALVALLIGAASRVGVLDKLGTAATPFVGGWDPEIDPLGLATAALVCLALTWVVPQFLALAWSPWSVALSLYVMAVALGLAINLGRDGIEGWSAVFDLGPGGSFEAKNEYLPSLPALGYGTWFYLDRFAEMVTGFSPHVAGHPPGPLLLMDALRVDTAGEMAALCVLGGACCAPLTYRLGITLSGEPVGRVAGLLAVCSPLTLLYGVSSYDYVFAAIGALAACLLVARRWLLRALGGVALGVAALFGWATLAIGAWAAIVALRRDGVRAAAAVSVLCAAGWLLVHGGLALRYGYDPIGTLHATEQAYRDSVARIRPYWYWVIGSPVAWGLTLGLPIVATALRSAVAGNPAAVALAGIVAVAAIGGFTKAETERIWLFMVPLACVAAAPYIRRDRIRLLVGALLAQALAMQLLMETVW